MQSKLLKAIFLFIILSAASSLYAGTVSGFLYDVQTKEPIVGVTVWVKGTNKSAITDADGRFTIQGVNGAKCTLVFSCMSYKTIEMEYNLNDAESLSVLMESEDLQLDEVLVQARRTSNTEMSMIGTQKSLSQVTSGVSAAQISKSPDRVASEVVKRISGVTVIEDRFIIVRGLSQRYNNAWINGLALPSTEIDSRAFPFDLLPSSQIDNMLIYKSPSPEIPGDFSGGFVKITSKGVPDGNRIEIGYTTGFNLKTQFNDFRYTPGSGTDFLGFDAGKRSLSNDFPNYLNPNTATPDEISLMTKNGFNNDWRVKTMRPIPDQRFSFMIARRMEKGNGKVIGNITAVNYSNTFKNIENAKNARYGIYSPLEDMPIYLDNYFDNQYSNDARLGLLHNWAFILSPSTSIEFKNLLNILGRNRLTERVGVKDMSSMYYREQTEMQYTSRLTYSGQLSGMHDFSTNKTLTWDAGYAYANRHEPDRRIVTNQAGIGSMNDIPLATLLNDNISRYFQHLEDHSVSAAVNYKHIFAFENFRPTLKTGLYGEYRSRDYRNREFLYRYGNLSYEERQSYLKLPFEQMLEEQYLGADKVYIDEITRKTNDYSAIVGHIAGYVAVEIPLNKLSVYAGARLESHNTRLTRDRSMSHEQTLINHKNINDLNVLPSLNLTYKFSEKHQVRGAYGLSVNRPELREISPAVYFDFDLFSEIGGNENLKTAVINNVDLRYEFYPNYGENITVGLFYKHFKNPIERTFIDMGGTLRYLYENAYQANNYGVEIEMRKKLDFIGLPNFTLMLNASLIESKVSFRPGEVLSEPDRPMEGQSPYIINAGLYYRAEKSGWDLSLLYNRIGKRIVGLGKSDLSQSINNKIPDAYEMPRDVLDLTISKSMGKYVELRFSIKDIFAADILFKQFPKFEKDGKIYEREQTTRQYEPGQSVSLGINIRIL
ncbi:MAG: outer membrane beta-barrel protein [Bacteroidales bacterium]|nr:outer membrane beta-barrel protein [Bacteroidales bacterium]